MSPPRCLPRVLAQQRPRRHTVGRGRRGAAVGRSVPEGAAERCPDPVACFGFARRGYLIGMYISIGAVVLILIIAAVVMLARRA